MVFFACTMLGGLIGKLLAKLLQVDRAFLARPDHGRGFRADSRRLGGGGLRIRANGVHAQAGSRMDDRIVPAAVCDG